MAGDDWGAPLAGSCRVAGGDDWGISTGTAATTDADIEALLAERCAPTKVCEGDASMTGCDGEDEGAEWKTGILAGALPLAPQAWPCLSLAIYTEPSATTGSDDHENELFERYKMSELSAEESGEGDSVAEAIPQEEFAMADVEEDEECGTSGGDQGKWLLKLQRRLERSPTQVVRYSWGGEPLWVAPPPTAFIGGGSSPPPCCRCGAARQFELQLLPSLPDQARWWAACQGAEGEGSWEVEWGTVVVYTCSADCSTEEPCEEFVVVQPPV